MNTLNLRYVTLSDDPSLNYVIFETDKYDIELNDKLFQVIKNILSMNDNEILHMYNEIVNIMDQLTIIFLRADSSQTQLNYDLITTTFDHNNINKDMVKYFEKLKRQLEIIFNKIKVSCYQKNIQTIKYYEPNVTIDKLIEVCDIMIDSFTTHPIDLLSSCFRSITNNIIEDEKDRLMTDEIKEASKRNENVIVIDSCSKDTSTVIVYVSRNNELILSKMKNKKKKYLINIKKNTCTCPDFRLRKIKQGLCCKHLMEIRNKSHCLLFINKVMNSLSQNSYNNSFVPFKQMLHVTYDKSINYNS